MDTREEDDEDRPGPSNRSVVKPISPECKEVQKSIQRKAVEQILQMFPDCDLYYVVEEIAEFGMPVELLADKMATSAYPKLKDRLVKERQELSDSTLFREEEFLKIFPDPEAYFVNTQRVVGELYCQHAFAQLQNDFPHIDANYLRERLEEHNKHYLPALRAVREAVAMCPMFGPSRRSKQAKFQVIYLPEARRDRVPLPDEVDELFFREFQYCLYEDRINAFLRNKADELQRFVAQAGEPFVCPCCYKEDILPEELVTCANAASSHRFCQLCVQRHTEVIIGQGRHKVTCLSRNCDYEIPLAILRAILQPRLFELILRRSQQEEIRQAGMENMETCPFCDFAIIMDVPVENDRVFSCHNPECLKNSCRLCKEPDHSPMKCNEIEKGDETAMRTFVENRMAAALIRSCPKCNKRIIKEDGCNKMTCPCGVNFCYVCGQELDKITPYSHFTDWVKTGPGGTQCLLYSRISELHEVAVKNAGEKAREEYLSMHPEFREDNEKAVDVEKLVDKSTVNDSATALAYRGAWVMAAALDRPGDMWVHVRAQRHRAISVRAAHAHNQAAWAQEEIFRLQRDLRQCEEDRERERLNLQIARLREQRDRAEHVAVTAVEEFNERTRQVEEQCPNREQTGGPLVGLLRMPDFEEPLGRLRQRIFGGNGAGVTGNNVDSRKRQADENDGRNDQQNENGACSETPVRKMKRRELGGSTNENATSGKSPVGIGADSGQIRSMSARDRILLEVQRLRNAVRDMNGALIEALQRAEREKGGQITVSIRDRMRARDAVFNRLNETEARALRMGITEEEMNANDENTVDTDVARGDNPEPMREAMEEEKQEENQGRNELNSVKMENTAGPADQPAPINQNAQLEAEFRRVQNEIRRVVEGREQRLRRVDDAIRRVQHHRRRLEEGERLLRQQRTRIAQEGILQVQRLHTEVDRLNTRYQTAMGRERERQTSVVIELGDEDSNDGSKVKNRDVEKGNSSVQAHDDSTRMALNGASAKNESGEYLQLSDDDEVQFIEYSKK